MEDKAANLSKGEASQQRIVEAAYALFLEQGYHGTSMRQIAERAGLTMGASTTISTARRTSGRPSLWPNTLIAPWCPS